MRILFISNLFPDASAPYRGIHNAAVLRRLAEVAEIRVISPRPVPFFRMKTEPLRSCKADADCKPVYPLVRYVPKFGSYFNHRLYARDIHAAFSQTVEEFVPDIVLSAWMYPDACAVAGLCAETGLSHVMIAQGTDVHYYLSMKKRRRSILTAAEQSLGVITRSENLKEQLLSLGVPSDKVRTIYNGVDLDLFCVQDRNECRKHLGLPMDSAVILFVGHFFAVKDPLNLVEAFAKVCSQRPHCKLIMIGAGPLAEEVRSLAEKLGIADRVALPGEQSQEKIAEYMAAADLLVVPSRNEGAPNVIREAFACGLPVVATDVGGIPELLTEDFLGSLVPAQDDKALTKAVVHVLQKKSDRTKIRQHADEKFSWAKTIEQYIKTLKK